LLVKYVNKLITEHIEITKRVLKVLIDKILDKAYQYDVLILVLTMVGSVNLSLADAINLRNKEFNQIAFKIEFNDAVDGA
jgi:hypothetical protein